MIPVHYSQGLLYPNSLTITLTLSLYPNPITPGEVTLTHKLGYSGPKFGYSGWHLSIYWNMLHYKCFVSIINQISWVATYTYFVILFQHIFPPVLLVGQQERHMICRDHCSNPEAFPLRPGLTMDLTPKKLAIQTNINAIFYQCLVFITSLT